MSNRQQIEVLFGPNKPDRYIVVDREAWSHRGDATRGRADGIAQIEASGRRLLVDDGRFQVWSPAGG